MVGWLTSLALGHHSRPAGGPRDSGFGPGIASGTAPGQIGTCTCPGEGCHMPTILAFACCWSDVVGPFVSAGSTPLAKLDNPHAPARDNQIRRTIACSLIERTVTLIGMLGATASGGSCRFKPSFHHD